MKSIHKKIIHLQARAMTKAVRMMKKAKHDHYDSASERKQFQPRLRANNERFLLAKDLFSGYSNNLKAQMLREMFYSESFCVYKNSFRSQGRSWALWWHGNTYSFKTMVFVFASLHRAGSVKTTAEIETIKTKIDTLDRSIGQNRNEQNGFISPKSIETIILSRKKTHQAVEESRRILASGSSRFRRVDEMILSMQE